MGRLDKVVWIIIGAAATLVIAVAGGMWFIVTHPILH